ncbi:MAG: DNA cytosine methyltransferase [Magnetococcales bacterium]|nr:DNA cytosine methyltransferase [Magnetococcales bacterium]
MPIHLFDFFCGCGGTTLGFQHAGLKPVFALDNSQDSMATFRLNFPEVRGEQTDITHFPTDGIGEMVANCRKDRIPILFSGCAPCQPFTRQKTIRKATDERFGLLGQFRRFVDAHLPDYVFVENVPGLMRPHPDSPLSALMATLTEKGYHIASGIIASQDYGVPQQRHRFVLVASRLGDPMTLPAPTHGPGGSLPYVTVRDVIAEYPPLQAGATCPVIPSHQAPHLSPLNLERLRNTRPGQSRRDWPDHLWLECHRKGHGGHGDVYGRMRWDEPASGLTTRCISLSNGRFGHPEQDRAISVREAAALQTFPDDFLFSGMMTSQARQIGNAVPPRLAKAFGMYILNHYRSHSR